MGANIAARLVDLAVGVVGLVKLLPKDVAGRHVGQQLVRAATGGGANYEEARAAESADDFIHKVGIAAKEVRESLFWLRIVQSASMTSVSVSHLMSEANQLAAILAASARTARERRNQRDSASRT